MIDKDWIIYSILISKNWKGGGLKWFTFFLAFVKHKLEYRPDSLPLSEDLIPVCAIKLGSSLRDHIGFFPDDLTWTCSALIGAVTESTDHCPLLCSPTFSIIRAFSRESLLESSYNC